MKIVRYTLSKLLQRDPSLVNNPEQVYFYLMRLCPDEKDEVDLLFQTQAHIVAALTPSRKRSVLQVLSPLVQTLQQTVGLSETSCWWALESWIYALVHGYLDQNAAPSHEKPEDNVSDYLQAEIESYLQILRNEASPQMRMDAAFQLGELHATAAVSDLIEALKDDEWEVVEHAIYALGEIADTRAVFPLMMMLDEPNSDIRSRAAESLGKLGPDAVEPLMEALIHHDKEVRFLAAYALGQLKDKRALPALKKACWDEEWLVREYAQTAINQIELLI